MINDLIQHSVTVDEITNTVSLYPSESWFAVASVEGIRSFSQAVESGRIKPATYQKHESTDLTCWRCNGLINHPVNEGMAAKYKAGAKFNDHWECRGKHNAEPVMCAACDLLADRVYHPNFKLNALYTGNKAYQLTLDEDLISFFLNPPSPPYLFCMAENNSQHMAWLSDYTFDSDLISIQKSRDRFLVSRKEAMNIAQMYFDILNLTNKIRGLEGIATELSTPLESTRREINNRTGNNMQLSSSVLSAANRINDKEDSIEDLASSRQSLRVMVNAIECYSMTYGTWYVATMFLKALLSEFEIKPADQWQVILKK